MHKFKISVYAIAKNEEKFAERWVESMSEADEIIVLDTGSRDRTCEILSAFPKVRLYQEEVTPWRFDTARNLSLSKVSEDTDYCVCTDLDEVFAPGWRNALEASLEASPDVVSYRYVWAFNPDGSENTVFNQEKIHRRKGFSWIHPVHEILSFSEGTPKTVFAHNMELHHYPDCEKSRSSYLPLLELAVKEAPENDRNVHYLGREYMFHGRYREAVLMLKKHLSLKTAVWTDERCASMRYIARSLEADGATQEAFMWLMRACAEAPHIREPWMQTADYLYRKKDWYGVIFFSEKALGITQKKETYITEAACWGERPYDLLAIAHYYTENYKKAEESALKALAISPDNERIRKNLVLFSQKRKEQLNGR